MSPLIRGILTLGGRPRLLGVRLTLGQPFIESVRYGSAPSIPAPWPSTPILTLNRTEFTATVDHENVATFYVTSSDVAALANSPSRLARLNIGDHVAAVGGYTVS